MTAVSSVKEVATPSVGCNLTDTVNSYKLEKMEKGYQKNQLFE